MAELDDSFYALTEGVIGAAIEVHRILGPGFVEALYEEALVVELRRRSIEFLRQPTVGMRYKGEAIGESRLDLLVQRRLIVELKAVDRILAIHEMQLLSYLRMTDLRLGLLINFNERTLVRGVRRVVNTGASRSPAHIPASIAVSVASAPLRSLR